MGRRGPVGYHCPHCGRSFLHDYSEFLRHLRECAHAPEDPKVPFALTDDDRKILRSLRIKVED